MTHHLLCQTTVQTYFQKIQNMSSQQLTRFTWR